ncbi:MAG: hypothetical protein PUF10_02870 [Bacteroidales bacterium]|nr:hypothetical protein [Bacteroidales bacterium]
MITAIGILSECVAKADKELRKKFRKSGVFLHFESGYTSTIVNAITTLSQGHATQPYPLVAVFTEGLTEIKRNGWIEFTVPKIAIVVPTTSNKSEAQRIKENFVPILYPIFEELERQLEKVYFGYDFAVTRKDIPYFTESASKGNTYNGLIDGIVIQNLKMKVLDEITC